MNLAADMGLHSGRPTPSLLDAPYRQFDDETGGRSTYPTPIPVQTNPATTLMRSDQPTRSLSGGKIALDLLLHRG